MEITDEIKDILHPSKTVIMVWDVQNRLVQNIFNTEAFLSTNHKLLAAARKSGVTVMFSKITPLSEKFESPVRKILFKNRFSNLKNTPDALELTIPPLPEETVIPKNTASIFIGTNFELLLRNAGITTIVFTGIATEMGVESSARDASNRGFFPVIVSDACSSMNEQGHNRSLENMKNMMIVLTSDELIKLW